MNTPSEKVMSQSWLATHSDLDWSLGWIVGPAFHRIHHSADPSESAKNFAMLLSVWDALFGTRAIVKRPARYGLPVAEAGSG